jgi:hypothetical protein
MVEVHRPKEITVEESVGKSTFKEKLSEKVEFLRTAFGGVPKDDMGEQPTLGRVPHDHPNV